MNSRNVVLTLYVLVIVCSGSLLAKAQPFGVEQGSPPMKYGGEQVDSKFSFYVSPPNMHPSFEKYLVTSTPETGICKVSGLGRTLKNDSYGNQVRSEFDLISEQVKSKYGRSKSFDFLNASSIWHDGNDWAMAVYKKDRHLSRFWDSKEHSDLSHNVNSISLQAHALNSSDTYLVLSFEFDNFDKCMQIINKSGSDAF